MTKGRTASVALALLGFLMALAAIAEEARGRDREASGWTREERILKRTDPQAAEERVKRALGAGRLAEEPSPGTIFIEGAANPELFLPWEVFQQLIMQTLVAPEPTRSAFRDHYDPTRRRLGLPDSLWSDLEQTVLPFATSLRSQMDLAGQVRAGKTIPIERFEEQQKNDCRLRAGGLRSARGRFGQERFDRFLYEAVAPTMVMLSDRTGDEDHRLKWVEEGCHD